MLNLKARIAAARQNDEGFTLIELAVVILIIGILLALALPSFLGVRKNAQHKAAQASVRVAVTTAKAIYSDSNSYDITAAEFGDQEPSKTWIKQAVLATPTAADVSVSAEEVVFFGDDDNFVAVSRSKGNRCYAVVEDNASTANVSGTYYIASIDLTTDPCQLPASIDTAGLTTAGWTQVTSA